MEDPKVLRTYDSNLGVIDVAQLCGSDGALGDLGKRIRAADRNGDGRLSINEFRAVFKREYEAQRQLRYLKWFVVGLLVACAVIIGANVGLSIATAKLVKDTRVYNNVLVPKGDTTTAVGTAQVVDNFQLSASHTSNPNSLSRTTQVVTVFNTSTGPVWVTHHVAATLHTPNVSATFITQLGDAITVDKAGTRLNFSAGATKPFATFAPATAGRRKLAQTSDSGSSTYLGGTGTGPVRADQEYQYPALDESSCAAETPSCNFCPFLSVGTPCKQPGDNSCRFCLLFA